MANFISRLFGAGAPPRAPQIDLKASRTGPLIAHLTYGGARQAPRSAVELTRLGYENKRMERASPAVLRQRWLAAAQALSRCASRAR